MNSTNLSVYPDEIIGGFGPLGQYDVIDLRVVAAGLAEVVVVAVDEHLRKVEKLGNQFLLQISGVIIKQWLLFSKLYST